MATWESGEEEVDVVKAVQGACERPRLEQIVHEVRGTGNALGCPLHQYKVDEARLGQLEQFLAARLSEPSRRLNRAEAAAFVLYCAHHFARTYSGGAWTWACAKGRVDPHNRLAPPVLYAVTERGLQAWGRSVYWNGQYNEYLYTVGREGGLPLAVLAHEKGEALRNYLQRLLQQIETTTVPAEEAAADAQRLLPTTLQQPEIVLLAAELVRRVATLRETLPEKIQDPIAWLDAHQAGWRDQLPLQTSDAIAATLIRGLVQQERLRVGDQSFALRTEWVNGRFQRKLEIPRQVTQHELIGSNDDVTLPNRLRLALSNGRAQSVRAVAMRVGDDKYAIERLNVEPLDSSDWFLNEVRLVIGAGERELVNRTLSGGEATDDAPLPWVFDLDSEERWVLAARGSYSSASDRLLVAVAPHAGELLAEPGSLERFGVDPVLGLSLIRVHGAARWVGDDDSCEIVPSHEATSARFELRGRSEYLAGSGSFVWRGCPEVWSRSATAMSPSRVPETQIEWKSTNSEEPWQRFGQGSMGDVQIRVRDGTRTLYRSRITVVPKDFRVELAATRTTVGDVRVFGAQLSGARVLTRGVEASVRREPGRAIVTVHSLTLPTPTDVALEVEFGASTSLTVRVPFPTEFRGFVSSDGKPLAKNGRIGLGTLSRWVARAVSCETTQRYVLEARTSYGYRAIAELSPVAAGVSELPLSRVRAELESVLSGSRSIDTFARLRISRETGEVMSAGARIEALLGWHETQLEVEPDRDCALIQLNDELRSRLDDWQLRDFRVLARPLHSPAERALELEGTAADGWLFAPGKERFWLLTGWVGNALMTRPRLVNLTSLQTVQPVASASEQISLESAMRLPGLDERRVALANVYERLATDLSHDEWSSVDEYLRTLHELPPPTYDVVCALAGAKPAAVVALFRQPREHFYAVWNGMERLGVSWQTIPLGLWLRAARLGQEFAFNSPYAGHFGGKEALLRLRLRGLFDQVETGPRFFQTLLAALNSYRAGFPEEPQGMVRLAAARTFQGRQLLRGIVRDASVDLRRRVESTSERFPPVSVSGHDCCPSIDLLLRAFVLADQAAFTHECLAAPLVAADVMINGLSVTSQFLDDLRLLRAFDEEWFDFAHAAALTVFLGEQLEKDNEFLERAEHQVLGTDR